MNICIENINISYNLYGSGKPIVMLHGWGQNKEMMDILGKELKYNKVLTIDLPGFGNSDEPSYVMTVEDYAKIINKLVTSLKLTDITLVGHSFGGRIAIMYASLYEVSRLVLLASPAFKSGESESLKVRFYKCMGNLKIFKPIKEKVKEFVGSTDYKKASQMMRNILVEHVNTDLTSNLKEIKVPTILIWGTLDEAVSIEDGKKETELICDAALIPIEGASHYAYIEHLPQVVSIINSFVN